MQEDKLGFLSLIKIEIITLHNINLEDLIKKKIKLLKKVGENFLYPNIAMSR